MSPTRLTWFLAVENSNNLYRRHCKRPLPMWNIREHCSAILKKLTQERPNAAAGIEAEIACLWDVAR
jgi:hypothetical protein